MIDQNTFGKTPAAMFLARKLNELDNQKVTRACGVRTIAFNQAVTEIERCLNYGTMTSKIGAMMLALLRSEANLVNIEGQEFISNLLRNTIIGNIKQALRRISVIRKIEINSVDEFKLASHGKVVDADDKGTIVYSVCGHEAGMIRGNGNYWPYTVRIGEIIDTTTPELLHEKSDRRCLRQGKTHMTGK